MSDKNKNANANVLAIAPQDGLDAYIKYANSYPMLSASEEYELAKKWRDDKDLQAAKALVLSHLRFVIHIARTYYGYGLPQADLIQEGNIGLMKAVHRFNPDVGVRLVSFAMYWIKAEIHNFILTNWRIFKIATTKSHRKLFYNLRKAKKSIGWFKDAEVTNVAKELGVSENHVRDMEIRMSMQDLELDSESGDKVADRYLASSDSNMHYDDLEKEQLFKIILSKMNNLDSRSKNIISSRWLCDDSNRKTLKQLAQEYNVSLERIRQIEKDALTKLRSYVEA